MNTLTKCGASLILVGTMTGTLIVNTSSAGAASNRTHLLNAWTALENDYKQIVAAIKANNTTNAEAGFIAYSRDCIPLATFETSFNSTISSDIFSIARLGNAWAWIGYITLVSNSGAGTFRTETTRLVNAITKFNSDLSKNGV